MDTAKMEYKNIQVHFQILPNGHTFAKAVRNDKIKWYYSFKDVDTAEEYAAKYLATVKARDEANIKERAERQMARKLFQTTLKAGDVLVASWGYDQTNVNWYQVTKVTPSKKSVKIREIAGQIVSQERGCDYVAPKMNSFIGEEKMRVVGMGESVYVDVATAHKWAGKPEYQTPCGMGH